MTSRQMLLRSFCLWATALLLPAAWANAAENTQKVFDRLTHKYCELWSGVDSSRAAVLYAKDPDPVFYEVAPMKYVGWNRYQRGVQTLFLDKLKSGKVTRNNDLRVTRRGGVVWTTVTIRISQTFKDGKTVNLECRHTAIWERRAGKWLIIHEHVSAPLAVSA